MSMTPEALKTLIARIPGWNTKSTQEILDTLKAESIPFENHENFTWKGISSVHVPETGHRFGRDGCKLLQDMLLANGEPWVVNQLANGLVLTDDEIQDTFYYLDSAGLVPGARHLAREVKRNISLLEQARIKERIEKFHIEIEVPSLEEIEACLFAMKLADWRVLREEQAWDRFQAYKVALTNYPGIGREPEL
jgi:hypothetical protein